MTVVLHHGDCKDIVPTLAPQSVDAIITDIPYGTTACKWDEIIPFPVLWQLVKHVLKPRGVFVTTASQPFASLLIVSNLEWFKYEWIWSKNFGGNPATLKYQPNKTHDNVIVFSQNRHTYNPQKQITESAEALRRANSTGKSNIIRRKGAKSNHVGMDFTEGKFSEFVNPKTVQYFDGVPKQHIEHPTQKPVALYEYLIKTYTNKGDTVLDFTMGSGTTGVAAVNTGRNFIGVELFPVKPTDPNYFGKAEKRIAQAQEARQLELV